MSTNHGRLCRDGLVGTLQIKSQRVLDHDANLTVKDAKVKGDLKVKGNALVCGTLTTPCLDASQYKVDGELIIDNDRNIVDNKDCHQIKFPKGHVCGFCLTVLLQPVNEGQNFDTTSQLELGAGQCRDSTNCFNICLEDTVLLNLANSGVAGLDTGSPAPGEWYAVYVIADSTKVLPTSALLSLDGTTPTTLPSGYDIFRRVGWARSHNYNTSESEVHFVPLAQKCKDKCRWYGYDWWHLLQAAIIIPGPIWVDYGWMNVDLSPYVPPTSCLADVKVQFNNYFVSGFNPDEPIMRMMIRTPGSATTLEQLGNQPDGDEVDLGAPIVVWGQAPGGVISESLSVTTDKYQNIEAVMETPSGYPGDYGFPNLTRSVQIVVTGFHDDLTVDPPVLMA